MSNRDKILFEEKWVLMTKDRRYIAKGANPRCRVLISVDDIEDKKRLITYDSEAKAKVMTKRHIWSNYHSLDEMHKEGFLEAVKACLSLKLLE